MRLLLARAPFRGPFDSLSHNRFRNQLMAGLRQLFDKTEAQAAELATEQDRVNRGAAERAQEAQAASARLEFLQ